jgi:adenylate cyclase
MNVVTLLTDAERTMVAEAAFLFTDIVGSTAIAESVGDERWGDVIRAHNAIIREAVLRHGGEEVAFLGDGFMIIFSDIPSAFACAVAVQEAFDHFPVMFPDAPVQLRIGLHSGVARREGRDVYGRSVHVASRIASEADAGEILMSACAGEQLGDDFQGLARVRDVVLKGLEGTHRLFSVHPASRPALAS